MILQHINLQHFRNYAEGEVELKSGLNWFHGPNGAGKSNLLEAILYLLGGRSHRARTDQELIRTGADTARIRGSWRSARGQEHESRSWVIETRIERSGQREWTLNDQGVERAEVRRRFPVILFTPDDLRIVKGAPAWRRRFLDESGELLFPAYAHARRRFRQVAEQRNQALKECRGSRAALTMLEVWNEQYVQAAKDLWLRRQQVVMQLEPHVHREHEELAPGSLFRLNYQPNGEEHVEAATHQLVRQIEEGQREEIARGHALFGPQRDDLGLLLAQGDARHFGSQGEQRSITLALKLGLVEALVDMADDSRVGGERPLLLLDDLFSELDQRRRQRLSRLLAKSGQAFVTGTEPPDHNFLEEQGGQLSCYEVVSGSITEGRSRG